MGQKLVSKVWSGAPSYQSGLAALERRNSVTSKMASTAGVLDGHICTGIHPTFKLQHESGQIFTVSFLEHREWIASKTNQDNLYRLCAAFLLNPVA